MQCTIEHRIPCRHREISFFSFTFHCIDAFVVTALFMYAECHCILQFPFLKQKKTLFALVPQLKQ